MCCWHFVYNNNNGHNKRNSREWTREKYFSSNNALLICWPPIQVYGRCTRTNERHHQMAKKTHNVAALAHGSNNAAVAAENTKKKNPNRKQIRKKNTCAGSTRLSSIHRITKRSAWCNTFKGLVIMKQDNKITLLHSRSVQFRCVNTTQMDYLNETCKSFIPIIIG